MYWAVTSGSAAQDREADLAGRVVAGEKPVAGALVKVEQVLRYSQDYLGTEEIATDENGRFVLAPVGANDYYVVSVVTGTTVPRELARTIVKVKGELTSADAGTTSRRYPRIAS